jgi:hypothetical protein
VGHRQRLWAETQCDWVAVHSSAGGRGASVQGGQLGSVSAVPCAGKVRQKRSLEQCRAEGGEDRAGPSPGGGRVAVRVGSAVDAYHSVRLYAYKQVAGAGRRGRGLGGAGRGWGGAAQRCNEGATYAYCERGDSRVIAVHCSLLLWEKAQVHRHSQREGWKEVGRRTGSRAAVGGGRDGRGGQRARALGSVHRAARDCSLNNRRALSVGRQQGCVHQLPQPAGQPHQQRAAAGYLRCPCRRRGTACWAELTSTHAALC